MRNKQKLTEELVQQLDTERGITVDQAMRTWWHNLRKSGGMRLTALGLKVFKEQLHIQHYEYRVTDPVLFGQKTILKLDRLLQDPYYIVTMKNYPVGILFFGSKEAMMVNLYGDLQKFLDNYS